MEYIHLASMVENQILFVLSYVASYKFISTGCICVDLLSRFWRNGTRHSFNFGACCVYILSFAYQGLYPGLHIASPMRKRSHVTQYNSRHFRLRLRVNSCRHPKELRPAWEYCLFPATNLENVIWAIEVQVGAETSSHAYRQPVAVPVLAGTFFGYGVMCWRTTKCQTRMNQLPFLSATWFRHIVCPVPESVKLAKCDMLVVSDGYYVEVRVTRNENL